MESEQMAGSVAGEVFFPEIPLNLKAFNPVLYVVSLGFFFFLLFNGTLELWSKTV